MGPHPRPRGILYVRISGSLFYGLVALYANRALMCMASFLKFHMLFELFCRFLIVLSGL